MILILNFTRPVRLPIRMTYLKKFSILIGREHVNLSPKKCRKLKRKVAKAQRSETADRGESNILIHSLKKNAKNTQQRRNNWIKVWKSWASENRHDKHIEEYEQETPNKIPEELYAT